MSKLIAAVFCAAALLAGCATEAPTVVVLSDAPSGARIAVAPDNMLVIRVQSNPSTGYGWTFSCAQSNVLSFAGSTYEDLNHDPRICGAPGLESFSYKVLAEGDAEVEGHYARCWEKGVPPAKIVRYLVHSAGNPAFRPVDDDSWGSRTPSPGRVVPHR